MTVVRGYRWLRANDLPARDQDRDRNQANEAVELQNDGWEPTFGRRRAAALPATPPHNATAQTERVVEIRPATYTS